MFDNSEHVLASATNPRYKLGRWLDWLPGIDTSYVKKFLEQPPNKNLEEKVFPNALLKDLFIRYNTPIPSSAAVKRLFSVAKDYLRPKRCRMTDKHFQMLLFLRANKS